MEIEEIKDLIINEVLVAKYSISEYPLYDINKKNVVLHLKVILENELTKMVNEGEVEEFVASIISFVEGRQYDALGFLNV